MNYSCNWALKLLIFNFLLIASKSVEAQNLKGKVTDKEGIALENVGIFNQTSGQHSHTNLSGKFSLPSTSINDSVYFSNLGFKTFILVIKQQDIKNGITITLEESSINLDQVVVVSKVDAMSKIVHIDVQNDPVKSSQEILRKVPGLLIGQHAGGGKAEQIFLRGFDIDHGTDVAISVDGMPVNMVSHAHGQGYADLHFVIPETIDNINFGKGPYYADKGDFNTAGYVDLSLKKSVAKSMVSYETGQYNTNRFVGLFNILKSSKSDAYLASEIYLTDGPFDSPQNFNRVNILGRYHYKDIGKEELTITASHFQSKWDASGQIPQRAIDQNIIGRFGAIDDTEGGQTSRTNVMLNHTKFLGEDQFLKTRAFVSKYDFELFSNFTFFLEDPINGDQIRQYEDRTIMGAETVFEQIDIAVGADDRFKYAAGIGFKNDNVDDVTLEHTLNRKTSLEQYAFGDVDETNIYGFLNGEYKTGNWTFNPSVRLDYFNFNYENKLSELYDNKSESKAIVSPKFNTLYSVNRNWQLFLKTGLGFHSNDARVVTANEGRDVLPKAYGVDFGTIIKPIDKLVLNATLWGLILDQEFVYVGDAGIVEPSGKTRRVGIEVGARYQMLDWLYLYSDVNYTYARSTEEADGEDYIPLAPDFTAVGGLSITDLGNFSGNLNYRYLGDRAANEVNSIIAEGYFVTDLNLNYHIKNWTVGVIVENLFDTEWNETQFATESRLFNETASVEEIHFTPGTPFYLRGKVSVRF
ncbi:outer membrane receptor protein involved in Fe transport [Maribacter caenipelagi]|uniref:Outer membrane receptor protein involved in Fe transport n=1 Tax=Maribacter caenipelagi TaxID=1447781 RepID=A0A4R7D5U5_9FLAO|nr:TonB-dependent receptor plug domain-containing protein [Maribacter caenipelagi]TDS15074.1 outer membrane receptor protein involved in Fe transport [Maribacter caenipelagi]